MWIQDTRCHSIGMIVRCARFPIGTSNCFVEALYTLFNISPYNYCWALKKHTNKLEQNWIASVLHEPFNNVHAIGIVIQPLT